MKSILTNISISLVAIVVLVALFETYLWLRYEREYARLEARNGNRSLCTRPASDVRLVYEFVPNACGFNSRGFADDEHTLENASGAYRIVVIGDSVAQGQGVPRADRFSDLLADRFAAALGSGKVEMINLARSGYSTSQELLVLERLGFAYHPDLVIWSYVLNDPAHPVYHDANGELGRYFYRPRFRTWHYVAKKLFQARENSMRDVCGSEFHRLLHCAYHDQVAGHIRQLGQLSELHATPVILAIHPVFGAHEDFEDYAFAAIHEDLTELAEAAGIIVVDLVPAFRGYAADQLNQAHESWFDPWHPNSLGHQLIARYLFEQVRSLQPVLQGWDKIREKELKKIHN